MNKVMTILVLLILVNSHAVFAGNDEQAHSAATMKKNVEVRSEEHTSELQSH